MQLAGRLRRTTLGDLLGTLYRARADGVLELTEDFGPTHRIHLAQGQILALDSPSRWPPLGVLLRREGLLDVQGQRRLSARIAASPGKLAGEILLEERLVSRQALHAVLRKQLLGKLEPLFRLPDARIGFHVACPRPRTGLHPLTVADYLHGRPRARDRQRTKPTPQRPSPDDAARTSPPATKPDSPRARALRALGLPLEATDAQIKRAFRSLARDAHPDRFPTASPAQREAIARRFAALTEAYHLLLG